MKSLKVLLSCGTVGTVFVADIEGMDHEELVGDTVSVYLHDENGNPINVRGIIVEILSID